MSKAVRMYIYDHALADVKRIRTSQSKSIGIGARAIRKRGRPPTRKVHRVPPLRRNAQDECLCAMCWCECKKCKLLLSDCEKQVHCVLCKTHFCAANTALDIGTDGRCASCTLLSLVRMPADTLPRLSDDINFCMLQAAIEMRST